MKKGMLMPVCTIAISAAVLFTLSFGLKATAQKNLEEKRLWLMKTLLPESESFSEEEYTGEDTNIQGVYKALNGYVIETEVYGYAGNIQMFIGVSNEGTVTGVVVNDMAETYGLGAKALRDHKFLAQFLNGQGDFVIGEGIDAITGATVTSKAVAKSINSAVAFVTGADVETEATSWGG